MNNRVFNKGDIVRVAIHKNSYWVNSKVGYFEKESASGRLGVRFYKSDKVRYYAPWNVSHK
jgi:hypothetical protein